MPWPRRPSLGPGSRRISPARILATIAPGAGTGVGDQLLEVRLVDEVVPHQLVGEVGLGVGEDDPARAPGRGAAQRVVEAADRLRAPELGDRDQVELELQLRLLLELRQRRHRARELVVEDERAPVGGPVDAVDRPVQAPAVDFERRALALLLLAEPGLEQPGLERAAAALRLFAEEAVEEGLDPPHHRPLGGVLAELALGRDLGDDLAAARESRPERVRPGQGVAAGALRDRGGRATCASGRPGPAGRGRGRGPAGRARGRRTSGRSRRRSPRASCRRRRGRERARRARRDSRAARAPGCASSIARARASSRGEPPRSLLRGRGDREQRVGVGGAPAGGDRPRQLVLGRRVAGAADDLGEVAAAGQLRLDGVRSLLAGGGGSSRRRTSSSSGERASATPFSSLSR